jgi:hypothetical protein
MRGLMSWIYAHMWRISNLFTISWWLTSHALAPSVAVDHLPCCTQYPPDFRQPGTLAQSGLDAPEFGILTESFIVATTNKFFDAIYSNYTPGDPRVDGDDILIDISFEKTLASDPAQLIDHLDDLLLGGGMSVEMRNALVNHITDMPNADDDDETDRVLDAIFLIITSPEFSVQR